MRKFAVTAFVALYALLSLHTSAERAAEWAAKEAAGLTHHDSDHRFGKPQKPDSHLSQRKLFETEFSVELPQKTDLILPWVRHIVHPVLGVRTMAPHETAAARAPPFSV
jgi:hypothetical protein